MTAEAMYNAPLVKKAVMANLLDNDGTNATVHATANAAHNI